MATNTAARVANDLGLAIWLGGTVRQAVRPKSPRANGSSNGSSGSPQRDDAGRWMPVAGAAMAASMLGGARLAQVNLPRIAGQSGVASTAAAKTALLAAGAAATTATEAVAMRGGSSAARRLLAMVAAVLVGGAVVSDARLGEQQRPAAQARGMLRRLVPGRR